MKVPFPIENPSKLNPVRSGGTGWLQLKGQWGAELPPHP